MLIEKFGVVTGLLPACESVEHTADRFEIGSNLGCASRSRSLENHVLDEMGDPGRLIRFVSGTDIDP
jgi:hypothetical protein